MSTIALSLPSDRAGVSRRGFVLGASTLVAGTALLGGEWVGSGSGLDVLAASDLPRLGVGFIEASTAALTLAAALTTGGGRVVSAVDIAPDPALVDVPVHITVHGAASGAALDRTEQLFVDAHIADPSNPQATLPFYAWTHRRHASTSGRARFAIAPATGTRVGISATATDTALTVFTSGRHATLPKLRAGWYLLGFDPAAWQGPTTVTPDGLDGIDAVVVSVAPM